MSEIPVNILYVIDNRQKPPVSASIPQLPGVVSQGETVDEARENLIDALSSFVESYEDRVQQVVEEWQSSGGTVHVEQASLRLTIS